MESHLLWGEKENKITVPSLKDADCVMISVEPFYRTVQPDDVSVTSVHLKWNIGIISVTTDKTF